MSDQPEPRDASEPSNEGWEVPEPVHFSSPETELAPPDDQVTPDEGGPHLKSIQAEPDTLAFVPPDHLPEAVEIITEQDVPDESTEPLDLAFDQEQNADLGREGPGAQPSVGSAHDSATRLATLIRQIERYPNSPVNYVLRGEVYLEIGDAERAAADFRRVIELAEQHDETLDWGYINAAYLDRAAAGLRQIERDR